MRVWISLLWLVVALVVVAAAEEDGGKKKSVPPFFLQDPTDSLCLTGEEFKRCSIDTLFYVMGAPGQYQIHKRPLDETKSDAADDICLGKKSCAEKDFPKPSNALLTKCAHCGAKTWNILGDAETGYILTQGEGEMQSCLKREGTRAMLTPCNNNQEQQQQQQQEAVSYTALQLQFASASDITAMSSPAARLIGAANDGDKKLVQQLLKEVEVNVRDWDDLTAIIPASSSGQVDIVKLLIKEGADVNAKDKDGITALMEASIMGHTKIVELLMNAKAEVDEKSSSEVTALWLAAGEGKNDAIKLLMKKGADVHVARTDGITALMTASVGGHVDTVKLLLEHGADPTIADNEGVTPLINAAENANVELIKLLVGNLEGDEKLAYINAMSNTGYNALIVACAHGNTQVVEYLMQQGADPNAASENGVTALMYAAASSHLDVMKLLIEVGKVDVNVQHGHGGTAMLEASTAGKVEAIQLLYEHGGAIDLLDSDGVTPLMTAASAGNYEVQQYLLEKLKEKFSTQEEFDKHMDMPSYSGGTAVMFAAAGGHLDCMKQLMGLGADINGIARATPEYLARLEQMIADGTVQDPEPHVDGMTGLHVASQAGHLECIQYLIEHDVNVNVADDENRTPLLMAVKGNHGEVSTLLVAAGADPNTQYVDDEQKTHNLLMDAITVENSDFSLLLIEKGADLYYKDERKVSTLLQAAHRGMVNVVKALLEMHAKSGKDGYVGDASDDGITPLIAAASEGHVDIVAALIERKADLDGKDNDGTNALMAASARGHVKAAELLVKAGAKVNEQNSDGHTALMFAYNGKNQVETLWERYNQFKKEDDGKSKDDGGTGPLIQDALDNHTALVELLIKSGADVNLKDKEGHTAKDFDFHPDADSDVLEKETKAEQNRDESKNEL